MMKCIGFGEFKDKCENVAGTKWSPYWCGRCNTLRFEHIDKGFEKCQELFELQKSLLPDALKEVTNE